MNEAVEKIRRLLDAKSDELKAQAEEMILSLEDPGVDAWVLSDLEIHEVSHHNGPGSWGLPAAPLKFWHHTLGGRLLETVIGRTEPGTPAAAVLKDQLPRLYVAISEGRTEDLSWLRGVPGLTELLVTGPAPGYGRGPDQVVGQVRVTGLDVLARLPALTWLAVCGAAELDLAPLVALPGLRRLSLYGCTLAADTYDLPAGALERLDLAHVPGLTHLAPPPTLRELHLTALGALAGIGDLSALTDLTALSIVDCPGVTTLPAMPPATGSGTGGGRLRRVRFGCPALTSIAPLAGRPLESVDLTGCTALASLDGFPETIEAARLSLRGCAALRDVSAVGTAAPALRCLDLRDAAGVTDLAALDRLPDLGTVALFGSGLRPETVPVSLLPRCTWAHTPDLDLLAQRPRQHA